MKAYFRHVGQTFARTIDFNGRSRRRDVIDYIVITAAVLIIVNGLAGELAPQAVSRWLGFAVQYAVLIPAAALTVRRFHDIGWSGRWSLVLLAVALRNVMLDLLSLVGAAQARTTVEGLLGYVDWLLFLPFLMLYLILLLVPGKKGPNRYGPDPRKNAEAVTPAAPATEAAAETGA